LQNRVTIKIFYGKLINISPVDIETEDGVASFGKKYTFEVFEKWKGGDSREVDFYQMTIGCNFHFDDDYGESEKEGTNWIVSLEKRKFPWIEFPTELTDSVYYTTLCSLNFSEEEEGFELLKSKLDQFFPNKIQLESQSYDWRKIQIIAFIIIAFTLGLFFGKIFK